MRLRFIYPVIFIAGCVLGLLAYANAQTWPPNRSAVLKLTDPWGQIGADVNVQAVEVGGMQCAVLTQRNGADRRVSLWCK